MALLSVIIPFGLSKERSYIKDRVISKALYLKSDENIEYIFVEGYSSLEHNLKQIIEDNGHIYLKDETQKAYFSQGKCRNLGASYAHCNVLLFLDIDCYISFEGFQKILKLIQIKNISQNINALMVLPVVYLNQKASKMLKQYDEQFWDTIIQEDLFMGRNTWVKFFALSSTSSVIINKHQFLKLGGNDEKFIGHGYEDFDLFARILIACAKFEKMPSNLNYDARNWNFINFKGFRSWFSLLGYEASFHGIYMYHFWHIEPNQNAYMENKDQNHQLFYKHLKNIKMHNLKPLQVFKAKDEKVLVLFRDISYDFRDISVYMGEFIYKNIDEFYVNKELKFSFLFDFLKEKKITKIFLDENIRNESLINSLSHLDLIYFKKGVLPYSWLFSRSLGQKYEPYFNLNEQELENVKEYFLNLNNEEKKVIFDFAKKNCDVKCDIYKLLYHLINQIYSFEYEGNFYQIIIDEEKIFMGKKYDKTFYSLKSFVYKPYLYELARIKPFLFLMKISGFDFIMSVISHTKFYRLARKLFFNPQGFFEDFKIKRIK
ncbi:galactosyltransferase-related protein [Campylobacter hepaticus]|uniref:galactosyltransferase-related protein n=1 Tax=Campylobacter hepaticus TaxID=1813019 RepID=UPI0029B5CDC2|nr:galactosyltransferase-related protein [Campylobacter hepaticus]MDX2331779.1 galactosyltransferase-related protein [Campylobacter hepaticus]MDX2372391.1 galactosyltransferase-related protein [Campylobacter hepaticus]MDX2397827.1 galactosyltransferase-related protein [Campylobacter hepaticus]MDX5509549.1 galactosyltransferase-related protein [Campylobacter hepaticus]